jgi:hypothetical protein
MSRQYFNGVSQVSYNGILFSFVITDSQRNSGSMEVKEKVVELISELEAVEGVCRYILGEIETIKNLSAVGQNLKEVRSKDLQETESEFKIGLRLNSTSSEHGNS